MHLVRPYADRPGNTGNVELTLSITWPPPSALPSTPTKGPWPSCLPYRHLRFLIYMLGITMRCYKEPDHDEHIIKGWLLLYLIFQICTLPPHTPNTEPRATPIYLKTLTKAVSKPLFPKVSFKLKLK